MTFKNRQLAGILAAVMLAGTLCGCSASMREKNKDEVSISVAWHTGNGGRANAYKQINQFKKQYGNIDVKPDTWIIDTATYYMKAATGRLPTLFSVAMTEADRFKRSGFDVDLSEYMKKYGYEHYIRKEIKDIISEDGKYYAVPAKGYLLGVVFNRELFERAGLKNEDGTYKIPKTYVELAEVAERITEATGVPGLIIETDKRTGGWIFTNIAWAYGAEFIKYENGKWKAAFNSPECVKAFQYIYDLKWKYKVLPENSNIDQYQANKRVLEGKCAMIIDGGIDTGYNAENNDKNARGMFSMPAGPAGKYELLGGIIYGISNVATDEQVDAAFKWLEYSNQTPSMSNIKELEKKVEQSYQDLINNDRPIGLKNYSIWTEDCPRREFDNQMREKYKNVPDALFADFNDMIDGKIPVIIKPEERVSCQDLYYILTECLNEIYTNENVDIKKLTADAAEQFQTEYLDKIN